VLPEAQTLFDDLKWRTIEVVLERRQNRQMHASQGRGAYERKGKEGSSDQQAGSGGGGGGGGVKNAKRVTFSAEKWILGGPKAPEGVSDDSSSAQVHDAPEEAAVKSVRGNAGRVNQAGPKHLWLDGLIFSSGARPEGQGTWKSTATATTDEAALQQPPGWLGFKFKSVSMTVVSVEEGGPAHKHGNVHKHDKIVAVNGQSADSRNIDSLLRADDPPGTLVELTLEDSSTRSLKHIVLTRAPLPDQALKTAAGTDGAGVESKKRREFNF